MDTVESLGLASAGEIALAGILIGIVVAVAKKAGLASKYLPAVAIVLGALVGVGVAFATKAGNYAGAAIMGVIVGAGASGVYDATKPLTDAVSAKVQAKSTAKAEAETAKIQAAVKAVLAAQETTTDLAAKEAPANDKTQSQ